MAQHVSRVGFGLALAALLAACGSEPSDTATVPGAPLPPPLNEDVSEDTAPATEPVIEVAEAEEAVAEDHDHSEDGHEHGEEDHDHDHDHADADKAHDHSHDHDDHAHDHDHDHAGGTVHVHGFGQAAFVREGETLSLEMTAPLANFGLSGDNRDIADKAAFAAQTFTLIEAGSCSETGSDVSIVMNGQHGDATVTRTFTCSDASDPGGVDVTAFVNFPGFETVEAIYLVGTSQNVLELTPSQTEFSLR